MEKLPISRAPMIAGRTRCSPGPMAHLKAFICLVGVFTMTVMGCSHSQEIGFNRYLIQTPFGKRTSYEAAVEKLAALAARKCPQGYRKANDYHRGGSGGRYLVWDISCSESRPNYRLPPDNPEPQGL